MAPNFLPTIGTGCTQTDTARSLSVMTIYDVDTKALTGGSAGLDRYRGSALSGR